VLRSEVAPLPRARAAAQTLRGCWPLLAAALLLGCDLSPPALHEADAGPSLDLGPDFLGLGVGSPCARSGDCRAGLLCHQTQCLPQGDLPEGSRCLISEECGPELVCGWAGLCAPAGAGEVGATCVTLADCRKGAYCQLDGLTGRCALPEPGAGDLGRPCDDESHCLAGLACSRVRGRCVPGSLLLHPDVFPGVSCRAEAEASLPFGPRHLLPGSDAEADFYDTPFPSVLHQRGGHPILAAHPRPGSALLGEDPVATLLAAMEEDLDGFGLSAGITLRFTGPLDEASLGLDEANPQVQLLRLSDGAAVPLRVRSYDDPSKYVCGHRLVVAPRLGQRLEPTTDYALLLGRGLRSLPGPDAPAQAAGAIDATPLLLATEAPSDATERAAWEAYAPLRAALARWGRAPADLAGVALFRTGDPWAGLRALRERLALERPPRPAPSDWVLCESERPSPCSAQALELDPVLPLPGAPDPRACTTVPAATHMELHLRLALPVLQRGEPPYRDGGGELSWTPEGRPRILGHEPVCVALSLPRLPPPPGGWPLVIYGHGTGGTYRLGVQELAPALAERGVALLSWDLPLHGPRGAGADDPGPLVFRLDQPRVTRGNLYQGVADLSTLLAFALDGVHAIEGMEPLRFDPARIAFYGHSQGATLGALAAADEPAWRGLAFSGLAASTIYGILDRRQPFDASLGLRLALQELAVEPEHPVLQLLQAYYEDCDPLLWLERIQARPNVPRRHLLQIMGWDDRWVGWRAGLLAGAAAGLPLGLPDLRPSALELEGFDPGLDLGFAPQDLPTSGNLAGEPPITGVLLSHRSDGSYDGHMVAQRNPAARAQLLEFLESLLLGDAPPTVPAP